MTSLNIGEWAPTSILWVIVGLCPQLNKKTLNSTCFFEADTEAGGKNATMTSINASELTKSTLPHFCSSTLTILGGSATRRPTLILTRKEMLRLKIIALMTSTQNAYSPGTIGLFYLGMVYAARVSLNESHRAVNDYNPALLTIRTICFSSVWKTHENNKKF